MPRKSSRTAKKEPAGEPEGKEVTLRRSHRASKDTSSKSEIERSRRGSTVAQTAVSVAESRVTRSRNSVGSRRDSSSSENQKLTTKEQGLESPASRVKSSRRSTSRINYKESDGEEEVAQKREEDNFVSSEEIEESDSDDKLKEKSKSKGSKPTSKEPSKEKARTAKAKARGRGRPIKKKGSVEVKETVDISDDSIDHDDTPVKKKRGKKEEQKNESDDCAITSEKSASQQKTSDSEEKVSRRRSRSSSKPQVISNRPTRNKPVKKYTEDLDLSDEKSEEEEVQYEPKVSRKRKREVTVESNKKLKAEESSESVAEDEAVKESSEEASKETLDKDVKEEDSCESSVKDKSEEEEKQEEKHSDEEPMEIEEMQSALNTSGGSDVKNVEPEVIPSSEKSESIEMSEISEEQSEMKTTKVEESVSDVKEADPDVEIINPETEKQDLNVRESPEISEIRPEFNQEQAAENKSSYSAEESDKFEDNSEGSVDVPSPVPVDNVDSSVASEPDKEKSDVRNKETAVAHSVINISSNITCSKEVNDSSLNGEKESVPVATEPVTNITYDNKESTIPKENGAHEVNNSEISISSAQNRHYVPNSSISDDVRLSVNDRTFGFASYNISNIVGCNDKLVHELNALQASIIALQGVTKTCYDALEPSLDALGYKSVFSGPIDCSAGLATFYKSSLFQIGSISEVSFRKIFEKELESCPLDANVKSSVLSCLKMCGHLLLTRFVSFSEERELTVANVCIPKCDQSFHALQVSYLMREISLAAAKPSLLCGEFNMVESDASYQLLQTGHLNDEKLNESQSLIGFSVPEEQKSVVMNLLRGTAQHPSYRMNSCYCTVLGKELLIPEQRVTSPDLLWFGKDYLHTLGVFDSTSATEKTGGCHFPLKVDVAFSV